MPTRTWSGATNNNWGTSTNWVEGVVPTNADDVVFGTNVNCNVTSAAVCKTLTFGTYSGTFTNTGGLTVSGNVSLGSSVVWGTWSQYLTVNATATLTSNGKDIPNLQFYNTITVTLADNWTVTAFLAFQNANITVTLNSNTISVSGGQILHRNGCTINGTTSIDITGTVSWSAGNNYISNPININTAGTFTLSNNFYLSGNTVTWIAGAMVVTGSATVLSGNVTFTGTGLTFNNVTALTNTVLTLSNDITITGNLSGGGSAVTFVINGNNLYVGGGLSTTVNTSVSGTTNIILNGTGTIGTSSSSGNFQVNIEINTSGTITFLAGNFRFGTGTFKYTAGTTITSGNTFIITIAGTIDVNGKTDGTGSTVSADRVNFNNFTNSAVGAVTYTTPICVVGTYSIVQGAVNGANVYCQGGLTAANNTGGGTSVIYLIGSGVITTNSILRTSLIINTSGKYTIGTTNPVNTLRMSAASFQYINGNINTRNVTLIVDTTTTFLGFNKLRFKQIQLSNQITMDEFFQGSASQICSIITRLAGTIYNIQFTNGFQKVSHYTSIQDMTLINTTANRGSLLLTYSKANKGRNVGNITYINTKPNGTINYVDTTKSLNSIEGVQLQGDPAYN